MKKIEDLLKNYNGEIYNLCYFLLKDAKNPSEVFEFTCKNFSGKPKNGEIPINDYFSKEEIEQYESNHGDEVNGLLMGAIKKCNNGLIPRESFYSTLWNTFSAFFSTDKEMAFAFYYTLIDANIPFMYLGKSVSMSNSRFRELLDKNDNSIEKVKYIIRCSYGQRTEKASLLLNCLDEIEDFESKAVVLAQAIELFKVGRKLHNLDFDSLIRQIDQRIEELEKEDQTS